MLDCKHGNKFQEGVDLGDVPSVSLIYLPPSLLKMMDALSYTIVSLGMIQDLSLPAVDINVAFLQNGL